MKKNAAADADILQARTDMKADWIIFYDESKGRYGCVPVGSRAANYVRAKVIAGFYGTQNEAVLETKRIEKEAGITGIFPNTYSYKK